MIITNAIFDKNCFHADDIYIFAFGYEQRSYYLYDTITAFFPYIHPIVFAFDDYSRHSHTLDKINELTNSGNEIIVEKYADFQAVHQKIVNIIREKTLKSESITVHIDYSSMPRSWYCKLPILLAKIIRKTDKIFFWYAEGEYPPTYEEFPSAGIDSFSLFSGKPSLQIDNNRIHILGLGYDVIRSQAILSISDPNHLVICFAYNPQREGFLESIKRVNEPIFSRAALKLALHIDDFKFMVSKLSETATEFLSVGDVILIPDGPKPLIFAMSLIPDILGKSGLTCLHISRNARYFEPINASATGIVHGFSIQVV